MNPFKLVFSRFGLVAISILAQFLWYGLVIYIASEYSVYINWTLRLISIFVVLFLIKHERHVTRALSWIIIVFIFPLFGGILYLAVGANLYMSPRLKNIVTSRKNMLKYLKQDEAVFDEIKKGDKDVNSQLEYISKFANYPVYFNRENAIEYYSLGDYCYPKMLEELKKAKKFIFLEYFIINTSGEVWNTILEILEQKVAEGVDVRVIYDDFGSIWTVPSSYYKTLEKKGIKCVAFNRLIPIVAFLMNNRDHRKALIVDGNVAFTGGMNLSDEYINKKERFGHWKDNGIMIRGEAVWNMTVMFLKNWNVYRTDDTDYEKYRPTKKLSSSKRDGFIVPYGDNPLDSENVGEAVYLNIINQANKYVYIFTPYLIIDNEMISALTLASKRGIDVRIVTPFIPDKKLVNMMTKSYYQMLVNDGVKIYEYKPGFIHSKVFVCDDMVATVGTLNLDYRSLYLHFENGIFMYKCKAVQDVKEDCLETFKKSHLMTKKECRPGLLKGVFQAVMRVFAPLL